MFMQMAARRRRMGGFSPLALFAALEPGVWLDPSDLSTLFQDTAGTVPVTALGQSVLHVRDKSGRGNHATQAIAASQPKYACVPKGGRRNLLTYSENLSNAAWSKGQTTVASGGASDPYGSPTELLTTTGTADSLTQVATVASGAVVAFSFVAKRGSHDWLRLTLLNGANEVRAWFNLSTGAVGTKNVGGTGVLSDATISSLGGGYYRVMLAGSIPAVTSYSLIIATAAADASFSRAGIGATRYQSAHQLEAAASATPYQKVVSDYEITEAGAQTLYGLYFDGTDDFLVTPAINFTATDKMTVWAGVRSNAVNGMACELSASSDANGGFYIYTGGTGRTKFQITGPVGALTAVERAVAASFPVTDVWQCSFDYAGASRGLEVAPRINAGSVALSAAAGAGDPSGAFGNQPLYIGRRGGASLPFNGYLFGLVVRGAASDAAQIASTEAWLNARTGAY